MIGLRFSPRCALRTAAMLATVFTVAGCGGSDSSGPDDEGSTLLDTSVNVQQGDDCDNGAVTRDFTIALGGRVTITATGPSNRSIVLVLYAPDYSEQLGSAQSSQGTARLILASPSPGTHHLDVCEVSGTATTVRVVIKQVVL